MSARYYKDGSEVLIAQEGKNPRRLTPRECARLQGFPDTFKIPVSDTQAYKQFGNSVVVPLMGEVAKLIVNNIETMDNEKEQDIQSTGKTQSDFPYRFYVSDLAEKFKGFANSILPFDVEKTQKIDIEKY